MPLQPSTHLIILDAVEDEDEEPLEGVEDGEDVRHHHRCLVEVEQSKRPCETEEDHQHHSTANPSPARHTESYTDASPNAQISFHVSMKTRCHQNALFPFLFGINGDDLNWN